MLLWMPSICSWMSLSLLNSSVLICSIDLIINIVSGIRASVNFVLVNVFISRSRKVGRKLPCDYTIWGHKLYIYYRIWYNHGVTARRLFVSEVYDRSHNITSDKFLFSVLNHVPSVTVKKVGYHQYLEEYSNGESYIHSSHIEFYIICNKGFQNAHLIVI